MSSSFHFDHHRREAMVNKRRFSVLTAALSIVFVAVIGSQYRSSSAAQTTNPYTANCSNPAGTVLQYGSYSGCVYYLQWDLNHPVNAGAASLSIDGQFGYATRNAVINYQNARHLSADGIVGSNTWGQLLAKPTANLLANGVGGSISIYKNGALKISWSSSNTYASGYASCTGTYRLTGSSGTSNSVDKHYDTLVGGTTTLTYGLTCSNYNGTGSDSVAVIVNVSTFTATPSLSANGAASSSSIPLKWTAAATSSPATISSYTVHNTAGGSYTVSGSSTSYSVFGLAACTNYSFYVTATNSQTTISAAPNTVTIKTIGCPIPTAVSISSNGSITSSSIPIKWTASSGGTISKYTVTMRDSSGAVSNFTPSPATATNYTTSGLASCKSYTFTVSALNTDGNASTSGSYSASTTGCPVNVNPPPPPPSGGCGTSCSTGTTTSTTTTTTTTTTNSASPSKPVAQAPKPGVVAQTQPTAAGAPPADIIPPTIPDGFTASVSDSGNVVSLSWIASTDLGGIKGYNIERSTDQQAWDTLQTGITEKSFDDKTVAFSTHYFYRITATDEAGNTSDYSFANTSTTAYQPNAGSGEAKLTSDDKVVSVVIPDGAIPSGADCSVTSGDAEVAATKTQVRVAGPYQLLCKDSDGNAIASFTKAIIWSYSFKNQLKGFSSPVAVTVDDSGKTTAAKAKYNGKTKVMTFAQTSGSQTFILASKRKPIPVNLIIGILLVLGLFGGVITFVLRRKQQANYSEYIRSKYYDI